MNSQNNMVAVDTSILTDNTEKTLLPEDIIQPPEDVENTGVAK